MQFRARRVVYSTVPAQCWCTPPVVDVCPAEPSPELLDELDGALYEDELDEEEPEEYEDDEYDEPEE